MQFSLASILAIFCWFAVLFASVTAVIRLPPELSGAPSTVVVLLVCCFVIWVAAGTATDHEANRSFWIGATIGSLAFIGLLFVHNPDGPNNQTTLRPLVDIAAQGFGGLDTWYSFHVSNVVEYWMIPIAGFGGGLLGRRFASSDGAN